MASLLQSPSTVATDAEISALITSATTLDLSDAQMVALCRRALADLLTGKRPVVGYRIAGVEMTFSMFQAQAAEKYYQDRIDSRGEAQFATNLAEFP